MAVAYAVHVALTVGISILVNGHVKEPYMV